MAKRILVFFTLLIILHKDCFGQNGCSNPGQSPATAYPVCGTGTFYQAIVPACEGRKLIVPNCPGAINFDYYDVNPYWYKFTCFSSGTLGFLITPNDLNDDYDWQLFDITGYSPADVYTNSSLAIAANWSGNSSLQSSRGYTGITGASPAGTTPYVCASNPRELGGFPPYYDYTTFSKMPTVIKDHNYLLMVSHYDSLSQTGYGLTFSGGTAIITDTVKPKLQRVITKCDDSTIIIQFNKRMKCTSLTLDGSDFTILPGNPKIVSVTGFGCSSSFDLDSVIIKTSPPLVPGNYVLKIMLGKDKNTLLDICDTPVPVGDSLPFIAYPQVPTPMDSIIPTACAPDMVRLVFRNLIACNTIDANGSDFIVIGSQPVNVIAASGENCTNGFASVIDVKLDKSIQTAGNFQIALQTGKDGNTFTDECGQFTPPGATLPFATVDTVNADFIPKLGLGCIYDTLTYFHNGANGVNEWLWEFDVNGIDNSQGSYFLFDDYGLKHIKLRVSNGVCIDTAAVDINLDNELIASFITSPSYLELCPEDAAVFTDTSIGKIQTWYWSFGDGRTSTMQYPPPKYYPPSPDNKGKYYPVQLIVKNDLNCYDTTLIVLKVLNNCYIAVPTGFTPNGDGLNDFLYPLNAYKADNLIFRIFNRYGQIVFETTDWKRKWDGTINGKPQSSGTYVWMLDYTDRSTGQRISQKGTTVLIR